jgi:large subunit ribosomal protein L3
MSLGLVGRKVGMTRIFTDDGDSQSVTVLDVSDNRVTKALAGHLAKAGVEAGHTLREFRVAEADLASLQPGSKIGVDLFTVGQRVDVTGTTQGKGFAGAIKRHHFSSNRASHGNSRSHNSAGSIGQAQDPGRVFPGKKMAGHLGDVTRTTQSLEIVRIDAARQLLMIKGSVPGSRGGDLIVRPTVKPRKPKVVIAPKAGKGGK